MATLTLQDAESKAARSRPWTFRLEYVGQNASNVSGQSEKFWYATGRSHSESVEVGWGKIGAKPQTVLVDWTTLREKVAEKLAKGYTYVNTPFTRMTPENIALLSKGGAPAAVPPSASAPANIFGTPPPSAPPVSHLFTQPPPSAPKPKTTAAPSASLATMGEPWSLIRSIKVVRQGNSVTIAGYQALDDNGAELLTFDPVGGVEFAKEHDIDIVF